MMLRYAILVLGLIACPAFAQTTANLPVTCNASGTSCIQATPVTNPDGTNIGGGGGGTPTGSAGTPNAAVVTVQGISGGTVVPVSAAALPLPTGASTSANQTSELTKLDQLHTDMIAPTPAGTNILGKVGIDQTTPGTTNLVAAGQSGTWNVTNVSGTVSLPTGASTEATLSAASAKLPASLGAKTGATSLSVVPASDGFATIPGGNVASNTADSGNPVKVGGYAGGTIPTTVSNGSRVNLWLGVNGQMVMGGTSFTGADASSNTMAQSTITAGGSGLLAVGNFVSNGTTWDRARGDTNGAYVVGIPVATASAGTAPVVTSAVSGTLVGKASAGNLYGINVVAGASAGFVLVTNTTTAPADGAVTPSLCYPVAANGALSQTYPTPVAFTTGISISFSTTGCFSKTASATAFISVSVK